MSKYNALWAFIHESGKPQLTLTFDEIGQIAGVPLDHSFLKYKKELYGYGYEVVKIAMKARTVLFAKRQEDGSAMDPTGGSTYESGSQPADRKENPCSNPAFNMVE